MIDLHRDILELFAETAPTVYARGLRGVRQSTERGEKRDRAAAWKAAHPKRNAEQNARYRATHREEIKRRNAAYRAAHLEEIRIKDREAQRARRAAA